VRGTMWWQGVMTMAGRLPYRKLLIALLEGQTELIRVMENAQWHHEPPEHEYKISYELAIVTGEMLYERLRYYDYTTSKRPAWARAIETRDELDRASGGYGRDRFGEPGSDSNDRQLGSG